jgi:hypothetical protein
VHKAVGTASGIGLIISLPAAITMLIFGATPSDAPFGTYGLVNLLGFVCIVPLTVVFCSSGRKVSQHHGCQPAKKSVCRGITDYRLTYVYTAIYLAK